MRFRDGNDRFSVSFGIRGDCETILGHNIRNEMVKGKLSGGQKQIAKLRTPKQRNVIYVDILFLYRQKGQCHFRYISVRVRKLRISNL